MSKEDGGNEQSTAATDPATPHHAKEHDFSLMRRLYEQPPRDVTSAPYLYGRPMSIVPPTPPPGGCHLTLAPPIILAAPFMDVNYAPFSYRWTALLTTSDPPASGRPAKTKTKDSLIPQLKFVRAASTGRETGRREDIMTMIYSGTIS
ncbi:uncharacterized protein H6S33_004870 [Morchella sextelata]|uniref:uncharacterized protein n=1 Tax=Morchella sextelata TaxID=1174677 RepID=UPI001D05AC19|nr:uncharacterized protein H6S33_004870 [Morchella sextelata]KAH0605648.1 hypothetical protein H6S33_004870 [Morchella sextelata]